MSYTIGGSPVNERTDWRGQRIAGRLSRREERGFVGDPARYIIKGVMQPDGVRVTGFLEAATRAELDALCRTYDAMVGSLTLKTVVINGSTYTNCDLASFREIGGVEAHKPIGGSTGVRIAVMFDWIKLQ